MRADKNPPSRDSMVASTNLCRPGRRRQHQPARALVRSHALRKRSIFLGIDPHDRAEKSCSAYSPSGTGTSCARTFTPPCMNATQSRFFALIWRKKSQLSQGFSHLCPSIEGQTSRDCSSAAATNPAKSGCGSNGLDFNSGWNCTPINHG